jgi:hypothetical protein
VHLRFAHPGVVQHQGGVDLCPPARLARPLDRKGVSEVELDARITHDGGERRPAVAPEQHPRREPADAFRDK